MADGPDQAGIPEGVDHALPRIDGVGDRLLDERVHPGRSQLESGILVEAGRHGDDRSVDPRTDQCVDVGQDLEGARDTVWIAARIGDGDELHPVDLAEDAGMVPAHHPDAEETRAQCLGHQAPAPATASTAATMRSRSPCDSDGCTGSETTSRAARSVSASSTPGA